MDAPFTIATQKPFESILLPLVSLHGTLETAQQSPLMVRKQCKPVVLLNTVLYKYHSVQHYSLNSLKISQYMTIYKCANWIF